MYVSYIYTVWYDENDCDDSTLIITRIKKKKNRKSTQQFDERALYTVKNLFSRVIARLHHFLRYDIIKITLGHSIYVLLYYRTRRNRIHYLTKNSRSGYWEMLYPPKKKKNSKALNNCYLFFKLNILMKTYAIKYNILR